MPPRPTAEEQERRTTKVGDFDLEESLLRVVRVENGVDGVGAELVDSQVEGEIGEVQYHLDLRFRHAARAVSEPSTHVEGCVGDGK